MAAPLVEPVPIPDTFCSGVASVEELDGGCLRFYLYVNQLVNGEGPMERVLVSKIVIAANALPAHVQAVVDVLRRVIEDGVVMQ